MSDRRSSGAEAVNRITLRGALLAARNVRSLSPYFTGPSASVPRVTVMRA
jgi:hypothetical protein